MSLAPFIHACKNPGVHHVRSSAGVSARQSRWCPHRMASRAAAPSRTRKGPPTSATLCGPLVTYYVRHLLWLRAA